MVRKVVEYCPLSWSLGCLGNFLLMASSVAVGTRLVEEKGARQTVLSPGLPIDSYHP